MFSDDKIVAKGFFYRRYTISDGLIVAKCFRILTNFKEGKIPPINLKRNDLATIKSSLNM